MRISDWSSDVCSSDLSAYLPGIHASQQHQDQQNRDPCLQSEGQPALPKRSRHRGPIPPIDRKSVVSGKSVSVRVDRGGRRNTKKKQNKDATALSNDT